MFNRYNQIVKFTTRQVLAGLALSVLLASCSGAKQSKEAVHQGVMEYLKNRQGLSVDSMDVQITSVSFRGKEADASVTVSAKGATDHANSMQLRYVLEQQGEKWVVKGKSGKSEHGDPSKPGMAMPDGGAAPGAMPPGHPPTNPAPGSGVKQ